MGSLPRGCPLPLRKTLLINSAGPAGRLRILDLGGSHTSWVSELPPASQKGARATSRVSDSRVWEGGGGQGTCIPKGLPGLRCPGPWTTLGKPMPDSWPASPGVGVLSTDSGPSHYPGALTLSLGTYLLTQIKRIWGGECQSPKVHLGHLDGSVG